MKTTSPKKPVKKQPQKLIVEFPILESHTVMTQAELSKILKYLKKMCNDDFTFEFRFPSFAEMKP